MLVVACQWTLPCAAQTHWQVARASAKQLRVDGELSDWRGARYEPIGDGGAGRAEVALAYDDTGLFIAARVFDDVFVRTRAPSPREDALLVSLALGSTRESWLWLYAGRVGESPASAQLGAAGDEHPRALSSVRIVEGPAPSGYVLEAYCPWSSLPGAGDWAFARGAVYLHDVDAPNRPARTLPKLAPPSWLLLDGGPIAGLAPFLAQKDLVHTRPLLDQLADVRDDARPERVLVVGAYALVQSASAEFAFTELPVTRASDVQRAELVDLTGDAKPELLVHELERDALGVSELLRVYDLRAASPRAVFASELKRESGASTLAAELSLIKTKAGTQLQLRPGHARGAPPEPAPMRPGVIPVPVPNGPWLERIYAWDGSSFALRSERTNPSGANAPQPASAPRPAAEGGGTAALLQAYLSARGLPLETKARFEQRANVAEDARPERIAVFDRDCVIVGEGFLGGRDFFYLGLPVQAAAQVLGVFTGDVTGDGRSEVFVRVQAPAGPVVRDILLAYTFRAGNFANLLTVEIGRAAGQQGISNALRLVPDSGHQALEIAPGSARGWNRDNYPFTQETHDAVEPLLLPWKDHPVRYRYDGQRLVPCAGSD